MGFTFNNNWNFRSSNMDWWVQWHLRGTRLWVGAAGRGWLCVCCRTRSQLLFFSLYYDVTCCIWVLNRKNKIPLGEADREEIKRISPTISKGLIDLSSILHFCSFWTKHLKVPFIFCNTRKIKGHDLRFFAVLFYFSTSWHSCNDQEWEKATLSHIRFIVSYKKYFYNSQ
jgi:hypothetical protein